MNQVIAAGEQAQLKRRGEAGTERWPAAFGVGVPAATAVVTLAGLLLFYGSFYSIHQDLAGSALSGRLAGTLGESFRHYSIYFPPAERGWFSLAAQVAQATGQRLDLTVVLMTAAAVLFSTGFAYWLRRATVGASPLFFLVSLAVLTILPILFRNVFGLREHMVVLGLWPYLVLRVSDPDATQIGWRPRLVLGVWLGATLLFKYLYSIVVLLVELADAAMQRRPLLLFRTENLVAGAIVAAYLFSWLVVDSSQRAGVAAVISAIDANLADPRINWLYALNNAYFAAFFLLAYRIFQLPGRVILLGLALLVGAIVVAWVQRRWYSHHVFPIVVAYIAWWWMAGARFKWWAHAAVLLYLFFPVATEFRKSAAYQQEVRELDAALELAGHSVAGKRVGILTMHPSPYNEHLAAHGGVRWNASMNNSYVAAELKSFDRPENATTAPPPVTLRDPGRQILHDEMLRLWEDMPPDVLILDHSTSWPLRHIRVEWTHVFSQEPRFKAVLQRYRPVLMHDGEVLEFTYYVRAN